MNPVIRSLVDLLTGRDKKRPAGCRDGMVRYRVNLSKDNGLETRNEAYERVVMGSEHGPKGQRLR